VVVEREEHGNFHGFLRELRIGERVLEGEAAWEALRREVRSARALRDRALRLDARFEKLRQPLSRLERDLDLARRRARGGDPAALVRERELVPAAAREAERLAPVLRPVARERDAVAEDLARRQALFEDAGGQQREIPLDQIVRAWRPNTLGPFGKTGLYAVRLWEFVSAQPRESNTEGGIFPALFGTVLMVLLMTIAVVPLGVVAALYLHEYAREGPVLRAVRLAVSNLAGVPSIVFGMFGLELRPAALAHNPREALVEDATIQELLDGAARCGSKSTVRGLELLLVDPDDRVEVVLGEPVEG
jgi:phosphate transport system permease protein